MIFFGCACRSIKNGLIGESKRFDGFFYNCNIKSEAKLCGVDIDAFTVAQKLFDKRGFLIFKFIESSIFFV